MADISDKENVVVSNTKLEKVFAMRGGNGEDSYANNSQAQAKHARSMLHLLKKTLDGLRLMPAHDGAPFVIADLGCSSGSNALYMADAIVKHMTERYDASYYAAPEFSVFFSDLQSNDFNTLFQLLPPLAANYGRGGDVEGLDTAPIPHHRSYFAAGVPGSFHKRLFPARSIDVFYSTFCLHWLSQVPESVVDVRSPAYNKGKIYIHGGSESTAIAFRKQFQSDMTAFLRARSVEMKIGGSMFLAFIGRTSEDPTDQGGAGLIFGSHYQDAWDDLVQEGLITSEERDSFNIPVFASSVQEFKELVEAEGSYHIDMLQIFKGGSPLVVSHPEDATEVGQALANSCRSISGVLVDAHIGEELSNELFSRVARRGASHAKELYEQLQFFHIVASLSLA
ncbi:PREDICTED: indole-3-acetate O-methyltransferase 1-like [Ipomoea nil]|uniref:indole-3-acetate O-methyltransferase 1-like n=1 Tax=Ipomoea nil TaxID=35883 RepID=UPI000901510B|nr:PREDICTED: indole-3-acetate O-methyltransferase 1-like [Ipomoea nil]